MKLARDRASLVRKKGLEPSRYCYRQPLKLATSMGCSGLTRIR